MSDAFDDAYNLLVESDERFRSDLTTLSERDLVAKKKRLDRVASDPIENMILHLVNDEIRSRDLAKLTIELDQILDQIGELALRPEALAKVQARVVTLRQNLVNFGVGMRVK